MVTGRSDWRCPGILHATPARDGMLVRVRVPGGLLAPGQFSAIARASREHGDGAVDVTSRANAQLRGFSPSDIPHVSAILGGAGLLPSPAHDRVRNIAASPFAGVDAREIADAAAVVRDLDGALVSDSELRALPAKFAFAIDGGARAFAAHGADLCARAAHTGQSVRFGVFCAGDSTGFSVASNAVAAAMAGAARAALRAASASNAGGSWRIATLPAAREAAQTFLRDIGEPWASAQTRKDDASVRAGVQPARMRDCVHVVPSVPLGRIDQAQAAALVTVCERYAIEARLAAWRGIVLVNVRESVLSRIVDALEDAGLFIDVRAGYHGIAACSGVQGCSASLADVRADAMSLAGRLSGLPLDESFRVNLAGCGKRCAMHDRPTVQLVAGQDGYEVTVRGAAVGTGIPADGAMQIAAAAHGDAL